MVGNILLVIFFLTAPAGVLWLCRKFPVLNKIGPVMILYATGVVVGNLPWLPPGTKQIQELVTTAMIPLAIPMLLFNCSFKKGQTRIVGKALLGGVIAVVTAVILGFLLFRNHLGPEAAKIGGMATAVYIGGTVNLAAVQQMLGAQESTYIMMNTYDLIVSALYMAFLLMAGITLFRKFLPVDKSKISDQAKKELAEEVKKAEAVNPYAGFFRHENLMQILKASGLTLVIVAVSGGVALLLPKDYFMLTMILLLTTLGIAASFLKPVKKLEKSYDAGMYLIYIFSIAVASMADFSQMDLSQEIYLAGFLTFAVFVSLGLQALLAKLMKVDADSMVVASVAMINSAPFVPMMAAAMGNREALVTGITIGLIGYAIGNYLGVLLAQLLAFL